MSKFDYDIIESILMNTRISKLALPILKMTKGFKWNFLEKIMLKIHLKSPKIERKKILE